MATQGTREQANAYYAAQAAKLGNTYSNLKVGSKGTSVTTLQKQLTSLGYNVGSADGIYGSKTSAAVMAYQKANGLTADGIAGSLTQSAMYNAKRVTAPVAPATPAPTTTQSMYGGSFGGVSSPIPVSTPVGTMTSSSPKIVNIPAPTPAPIAPVQSMYGNAFGGVSSSIPATPVVTPSAQGSFTPDSNKSAIMAAQDAGVSQAEIDAADYITQTIAQNEPIVNPVPTGTSGGGTGTGGGVRTGSGGGASTGLGGGSSGFGSSASIGTGTSTGSSTGQNIGTIGSGGTIQQAPWQQYFDKAMNTQFSYDPATDNDYRQAASTLENQVTQMMVGRGGLYSSVAQSALTSRLIDLQVTYQKQAYDNFKLEQDYYMKAASFVAGREDAEFNKNMTITKFQADRQDAEFNKQMTITKYQSDMEQQKYENSVSAAQLRISQANASYNRQIAQAKTQQASAQTNLSMMTAEYSAAKSTYTRLATKWANDGAADYEVAQYFGVYPGSDIDNYSNKMYQVESSLNAQATTIANTAKSIGDSETYLAALNGFASETTTSKTDYDAAYSIAYSNVVSGLKAGTSADSILNDITSDPNRSDYVAQLGTTNYNKLLAYVDGKANP